MSIRTRLSGLALLLWSASLPLHAGEHMTMIVSPTQSFAPATLRIQVRVEPTAENRALEIIADSADFYRSSLLSLDGNRGPRVVALAFRSVPGGEYEISSILLDGAGRERARVRRQVTVVSSGSDR
jgi:hypothetical protein